MKHWKAIIGVIAVFLLGMCTGALLGARLMQQKVRAAALSRPPMVGEWMANRLAWRLRLDPLQRAQVRVITLETMQELRAARRPIEPQIEQILRRADERIRAVLRPEQREQYDRMIAARRAEWRR